MKKHLMPHVAVAALLAASVPPGVEFVRQEANPGNLEKLLAEVKAELTRVGDDVKKTAEDALRQAKTAGDVSAETKKRADDALMAQTALTEAQKGLEKRLEDIGNRMTSVEQIAVSGARGGRQERKSVGQLIVESDGYKDWIKSGGRKTLVEVNQTITSATGSGGDLIAPDRSAEIVGLAMRRMTIRDLLMPGSTTSNLVQYGKQTTRTNNARVQSEGVTKGESAYAWELADANVRTIAHFVVVARQTMDDAAALRSQIDGELAYGLDLVEEDELLNGSGTGQHLAGLITEAASYSPAFTVSGGTMIDTLRLALLQASLAEYTADGIVLHPTDWARIELVKDSQNRYLFANPLQLATPSLWGKPVVPTQSIAADTFLVGAFKMAAQIFDRMGTEILLSSEDGTNFQKNLLTIRAEKRLALAVKRSTALVTGDFGNIT